jgi:hypothetical protein
MSQYSLTDPWLPFWFTPSYSKWRIFRQPKERPSASWTEIDLYYAKQAVKDAYRDLILNY